MSKSSKKYLNTNLTNLLTPLSHKKNNTSSSPYNINDKITFKNNLERINKITKKEYSSKKNKEKQKSKEVLINNYFSQRSGPNTEGNDINIKKLKFTSNFLRNKIESMFNTKNSRNHSKKINFKNKNSENNNNFRTAKKVNYTKNIQNNNKKAKNNNAHFTKLIANSNKKIIDGNSYINDFNITNSHNRSNTQTNFQKTNKKMSNSSHKLKSYSSKYRNARVCEDMKKTNINKRITNQHKGNNVPNNIRQISPFYLTNNKISNTQNYFRNIYTKNKSKENQHDKEKLITEPKEIKNVNKVDTNEFILKDNSSYLVISKKPTQITNFIEKKENNKYINNFFNICENKKGEIDNEKNNEINKEYLSYEEIHFFFVKQIQMGNKLNSYVNCHKG